ncbi:lipid-A-disaccharide synthase [Oceanisphaera arctica]|uniref:Lipid-A-disaccharide synthase n=1 Tax=Oceanisphaera arctica TaxID=641510 RepID=A0A2P5TI86_9GAMM|nr:lipid-A-disaccharide synthase [Oceanisphaera arctica]PPL14381.1 lipid-A-disaccharide synthase [Oceanisphaera arctica]GHA25755.1 lipid-A-disaccharide synthase [Oceanisphaera arctica]
MPEARPLRIGIVAGEVSGDTLGAGLIRELRARHPDAVFEGIAGPQMVAEGCTALFEMEELAVMGLVEVLGRLPRILTIRKQIIRHFIDNPPDVFVGIDAPDFNIGVELKLRKTGIATLHYVSPSVWAWRQNRIHKIKAATDMVLAFLPFEKAFYDRFDAPCRFIGHTLADQMPLVPDTLGARERLGLKPDGRYLALLPGSRHAEVTLLSPVYLEACKQLKVRHPELEFVVPLVSAKRREEFLAIKQQVAPNLDVILIEGRGREVMTAADAILLASGTATLEAMLAKKPMVVGYKFKPVSYWLANKLVNTAYASLPNLLADKMLVSELIQHDCTPGHIVDEVGKLLDHDTSELMAQFTQLHKQIRCNADEQAALAVLELANRI